MGLVLADTMTGTGYARELCPNGAYYRSEGQRPGGRWVERVSALKGRTRTTGWLVRPLRASAVVRVTVSQGVALRSGSTPRWGSHKTLAEPPNQ